MKTFKQFLREAETNELREMIERDCGPFLREAKGAGFLYRGIKFDPDIDDQHVSDGAGNRLVYIEKSVRGDRKPRDTRRDIHEALNKWFDRKFGWKARSEGVFCFGEKFGIDVLGNYGDPCIIFPIGGLEYVWSENVSDMFVDLEANALLFSGVTEDQVWDWLDDQGFRDKGLDDAILARLAPEIIVKCNKYYAFPIEYREELKKALGFE